MDPQNKTIRRNISWSKRHDDRMGLYASSLGITVSELLRRLVDEFFAGKRLKGTGGATPCK